MDIEKLTITELREFYKANTMSIGDGKEHLRNLRDKYGMNDKEALEAFRNSKKLFEN